MGIFAVIFIENTVVAALRGGDKSAMIHFNIFTQITRCDLAALVSKLKQLVHVDKTRRNSEGVKLGKSATNILI